MDGKFPTHKVALLRVKRRSAFAGCLGDPKAAQWDERQKKQHYPFRCDVGAIRPKITLAHEACSESLDCGCHVLGGLRREHITVNRGLSGWRMALVFPAPRLLSFPADVTKYRTRYFVTPSLPSSL